MTAVSVIEVPVLVVGGGPTGLSASLLLSRHGIESLTIEKHPGTSIYPRATGINVRTMEIFRSLRLEAEVRKSAFDVVPRFARSRCLVDPEAASGPLLALGQTSEVSPSRWTSCSQYELEPILARAAAAQAPARLLFGTELLGFEDTGRGVWARIVDLATDQVTEVRSSYLIGADGSRSGVREQLGFRMDGPGELMENISIHFRAPLRRLMPGEPNFLHFVETPEATGMFVPTDSAASWMFAIPGGGAKPLSQSKATELVRAGAGVPDLDVEIIGTVAWTMQADWATRMASGRVFLAGDAAHRMTPAGGHGLNTGVQDVHNLCWKLAAVLQGWAGRALLDTYEAERLPVARFNACHSVALISGAPDANDRSDLDIDLGFTYESSAVISDGAPAVAGLEAAYQPNARPGGRAPHLPMGTEMFRTSTLDLFGPGFTLLAGRDGDAWCDAADAVARRCGIPMRHKNMAGSRWHRLYGVGDAGAVLVRPDGHVGWRRAVQAAEPRVEMSKAFNLILARGGETSQVSDAPTELCCPGPGVKDRQAKCYTKPGVHLALS